MNWEKTGCFSKLQSYNILETLLQQYICTPNQKTLTEIYTDCQIFTSAKEEVPVERLLCLHNCNMPASHNVFHELCHNLLHKHDPGRILRCNWIYYFLERHEAVYYVLTKTIATNHANAQSWDVMDDFFWKVCINFSMLK